VTQRKVAECFVILVRHASRERRWDKPEAEHKIRNEQPYARAISDFKTEGEPLAYALAGRLCDELKDQRQSFEVRSIIHGEHLAARQTAETFEEVLRKRELLHGERRCQPWLTPEKHTQCEIMIGVRRIIGQARVIRNRSPNPQPKPVCIFIGHQPYLTRIARDLLHGALPGDSLPLGPSEAACLRLDDKRYLWWLLTEKSPDLLTELKDKIKSKYDVAKFFLGAFVVNTGLILNAGLWGPDWLLRNTLLVDKLLAGLAAIAALVSLALTAATLFSYDRLMMPESFWSDSSERIEDSQRQASRPPGWNVSRPPSQAVVVLFYEMVHVWKVFFVPAIISAFLAVGLLVVALAHRGVSTPLRDGRPEPLASPWDLLIAFLIMAMLAFLIPALWYDIKKPRLGVDD
jgi:phosphohistidine phosphatase SixA